MDSFNLPIADSTHIGPSSPRTSVKRKQVSPLSNPRRVIRSASCSRVDQRIDPHVITDSQSNGLVSRIVGYYEKSQSEMERTRINYNRFGDFPIVHLKKHELKTPKVHSMRPSSVRIAPPNKTVFNKDFRASIMNQSQLFQPVPNAPQPNQSGLTMLRKTASQKSLNEPLSPHINEIVDYGANRSVLDALKEVSRKRINSEEMELDRTKNKISKDSHDGVESSNYCPPLSYKRPRDAPLFPHSDYYHGSNSKRKCSMNNDILSSLSSSKRMHRSSSESNLSVPARSPIYEDYPVVIITPPPEKETVKTCEPFRVASTPEFSTPTAFNQDTSPKPLIQNVKSLSLFNNRGMNAQDKDMRSYDDPQLVKSNLRSPDAEDNRINFIQPKYKVPEATVVKQGTKSKLSMMLSCLSGDFEDEKPQSSILASNDVVDAKKSLDSEVSTITSSNPSTTAAVLTFGTVTTSTVQSAIATPSISTNAMKSAVPVVKESTETTSSSKVTDSEVKDPQSIPLVIPTSSPLSISTSLITTTTTTSSTFQFGITSKPISSTPISTSISSTLTSFLSKPSDTIVSSEIPLLGTPVSAGGISMFGTSTPAVISDSNKSLMSFGTPVKPAEAQTTGILGMAANSNLSGFSFGAKNSLNVATTTSAITLPASSVTSAPSFKFGANFTSSVVPENKAPSINFGNIQKPAEIASSAPSFLNAAVPGIMGASATSTPKPAGGFSFNQKPIVPTVSATPTFDFGTPKIAPAAQPISVLGSNIFGNSTATSALPTFGEATAGRTDFTFGSPITVTPKIDASLIGNGVSFGKTTNVVAPTTGGFKFGGTENSTNMVNSTNSINSNLISSLNQPSVAPIPAKGGFSFATPTPAPSFGSGVGSFTGFQQPNPPAPAASGGFSFGQTSVPAFGASSSVFGGNTANTANSSISGNVNASVFGGNSNNTPIFGGSTNNSAPQQPQKENMFSFGQKSAPTANNLFDSKPASIFNFQSPQSAEQPKPSFSFGATPAPQPQTAPAAGGMFSFNSNANAVNNNTNNNSAPSLFNFSNNNSTSGSTGNLAPANNNDVSASFTFKAPSSNNLNSNAGSNIFGQSQAPPPAYSFGAQGADANKSFSGFGGSNEVKSNIFSNQTPQSQTTMSASFNFSGGSNQSAVGAAPSFNFSQQNQQNVQNSQNLQQNAAVQMQGNLFNIGPSNAASTGRRPIRTATRRLK